MLPSPKSHKLESSVPEELPVKLTLEEAQISCAESVKAGSVSRIENTRKAG